MQPMCASWLVECCGWEHQREKIAHRVAFNVSVTAGFGALSIFYENLHFIHKQPTTSLTGVI